VTIDGRVPVNTIAFIIHLGYCQAINQRLLLAQTQCFTNLQCRIKYGLTAAANGLEIIQIAATQECFCHVFIP